MNHGNDDDDDLEYPPPPAAGPSNLLSQLIRGGFMGGYMPALPSAYDEYYKAYSVAIMGGKERPELLYGGKTALDIPGPWTFQLRNPRNPTVNMTHGGVLEFIADEGIVHLPAWMMTTLGLNEGDPVQLSGTSLPKGKMVKIQAQSTDFLQVSDPKAVLESALRCYSTLTKGDIIEITYNSMTFEFLIMETVPEGPGISVIDTDLEVDFDTPVGYVEPPRPAPAAVSTMADKLKIDLGGTTSASAGSSRPASRASGNVGLSGDSTPMESFTGVGQSLSGKTVKGKGLAKKIEEVDSASRINRNDGPRIITPESLADDGRKVPAALVLPAGKFFFGYKYIPYDPSKSPAKKVDEGPQSPKAFGGQGNSLRNRSRTSNPPNAPSDSTSEPKREKLDETEDSWAKLGGGNTLRPTEVQRTEQREEPSTVTSRQTQMDIIDATMLDEDDFAEYDHGDEDHEDDVNVIEIDSD